jgi:hypothetical protein
MSVLQVKIIILIDARQILMLCVETLKYVELKIFLWNI